MPVKIINLGRGDFCVASSSRPDKTPALTIRRLPEPVTVGAELPAQRLTADDFEVMLVVPDKASADVLLRVATHIRAKFE
jgi:hypothetical protein